MGRVFRAHDRRLGRDVAVKVLPAALAADPARRRRFEEEARAAAALQHPNILAVHDIIDLNGAPVIVTELLDGETLRARISAGAVPPATVLDIATQLARGLAAAHARGIVHCDLKPENIAVSGDGVVKILDFGLARLAEPTPGPGAAPATADTDPDALAGTIGYMAPEQLRLRPVDGRTDLFALGCIVREMLTGRPAFSGGSPAEVIAAVLHADPDPPPPGVGVPNALEAVVRRCLEKDPAKRYGSSRDLLAALEVVEHAVRGGGGNGGGAARRRLTVAAAAAAVAAAVALAATPVSHLLRRPQPPLGAVAVLPFDTISDEEDTEVFADGLTDQLINRLSTIPDFDKVIARGSVEGLAETASSPAEIGERLGVATLVEGTVARDGDLFRVGIATVDATTGATTWTATYRRPARELLALEREVTLAVTRALGASLSESQQARLDRAVRAIPPEAYDAYLRGKYHLAAWGHRERVARAEAAFREAIELAPTFGAGWAGLSLCLSDLSQGIARPIDELYPMARAAADRALALDPDDPHAHLARGIVAANMEWDWVAAREHVDRALALSPNDVYVHLERASVLAAWGDLDAAVREAQRGCELDPLATSAWGTAAWLELSAGHTAAARRACERWLEREPGNWMATVLLAHVDVLEGHEEAAVQRVETLGCIDGCAWVWARAGRRDVADDIARRLLPAAQSGRSPEIEALAYLYAGLGDTDAAIGWLERAVDARARLVPFLGVLWEFSDLRGDPRFATLLHRAGLPEAARGARES